MKYIIRLGWFWKPYLNRVVLLMLCNIISIVPSVVIPLTVKRIFNIAYPTRDYRLLIYLGIFQASLYIISYVVGVFSNYLATHIVNVVEYKMCFKTFFSAGYLPDLYLKKNDGGFFVERIVSDVGIVSDGLTRTFLLISSIMFTLVISIVFMFKISFTVSLLLLLTIPITYIITVIVSSKIHKLTLSSRSIAENITSYVSEFPSGAETALFNNLEISQRQIFKKLLKKRIKLAFEIWNTNTFWNSLSNSVSGIWSFFVLAITWYLLFSDKILLGDAMALGLYTAIILRPFQKIELLYRSLVKISVSAERICEVLKKGEIGREKRKGDLFEPPLKNISLKNISFGYTEEKKAISNLDFNIISGEVVALVGPNGSGKSTLLRIIAGLTNQQTGNYLINNKEFSKIQYEDYVKYVSYIPDYSFFFKDSVLNNLPNKDLSSLESFMQQTSGFNILNKLPNGFDTILGESNFEISKGEKQRLALFRGLVKKPQLLLLDEATANLDAISSKAILQCLISILPKNAMVVFATHDISITKESWVTRIMVMNEGEIVSSGTSKDLLSSKEEFYYSSSSKV